MKIIAARFIPETVEECAEMLALRANRYAQWSDGMVAVAREWTKGYQVTGNEAEDDEGSYPQLLSAEDIRTLAIAYALVRP